MLAAEPGVRDRVLVLACAHSALWLAPPLEARGAVVLGVDCTGSLHTSVVERALRAGAAGTLVLSCHPRDCHNREGARWLEERLFHGREAELQERVDRRRVAVAYVTARDAAVAVEALEALSARVGPQADVPPDDPGEEARECEAVGGERRVTG